MRSAVRLTALALFSRCLRNHVTNTSRVFWLHIEGLPDVNLAHLGDYVSNRIPKLPGTIVTVFAFFLVGAAIDASRAAPTAVFVTAAQWIKMLADVKSQPGMKCENREGNQIICDAINPPTIWVFTRPGHPAHPAASKGVMIFRDSAVDIDRTGYYAGDRKAFMAWMEEFGVLDMRQIELWRNSMAH